MLQNRPQMALAALREAIDLGWRYLSWYHLDLSPNLDSIRDTAEFKRLRKLISDDMAAQAVRTRELRESGDLKL